jgi:hypothetical protein
MIKVLLSLAGLIGCSIYCKGQAGLYLAPGTSLSINAGTVFATDGLVLTPSTSFTLSGPNHIERNTTILHAAPQNYIGRVYRLASTTNPYFGELAIYYNEAELKGIPENNLTLNTHNGTVWQYHPVTNRDIVANKVTATGIAGIHLSELTLADILAPLPLRWGAVTVNRQSSGALIKWETLTETNVAGFQVERSLDGRHWMPAGVIQTAHNIPGVHQYSYLDAAVTAARTYYRVHQSDIDGHFAYSPVVIVSALQRTSAVIAYPNPAINNVRITSASAAIVRIKLFNARGQLLHQETKLNSYQSILPLSKYPSGNYYLDVLLENNNRSLHPLIKQ